MPKFEIKHFRSQRGHEGPGFYCILWVDGVKAAEAIDQGDGGCVHWHWFDQEAKRKFDEHVASLPEEDIGHGLGKCKPDADTVIVNLVCEYEMKKKRLARIKRDIKKHCCFRLKSEAVTTRITTPSTIHTARRRRNGCGPSTATISPKS